MNAFIIRPFGTKTVKGRDGIEIELDFDRVEADLIRPALQEAGIVGGTTAEIVRAGNIREDMFQQLLTADLVIADLSIHNANVFYELGVRHALRNKRTLLIRCSAQAVPFDLRTDRYMTYDIAHPSADLDELVRAIEATMESDMSDSPVFRLLPGLQVTDPEQFHVVPRIFSESVERAKKNGRIGDLELFGSEVVGCPWAQSGLRLVGRALAALEADDAARSTWEAVKKQDQDDWEANLQLGRVYARSGDLTRSDQALRRVVGRSDLSRFRRSEAYSLLGSNAKSAWVQGWMQGVGAIEDRRRAALKSPDLKTAYLQYLKGYLLDLNHYYSGVNVAALSTITVDLAEEHPEIWEDGFDSAQVAREQLKQIEARKDMVLSSLSLAIESARERLKKEDRRSIWLDLTRADVRCLTLDRSSRVARSYREALKGADLEHIRSARRQLDVLDSLGIRKEIVGAALGEFDTALEQFSVAEKRAMFPRMLLFTGHRIDDAERSTPRFPAENESLAREAIKKHVSAELEQYGNGVIGMAGGASGGDILFHEVCLELGIHTRLYLALPRDMYVVRSVQAAGPRWVERFHALYDTLERRGDVYQMEGEGEVPAWLRQNKRYTIWQRNNLWQLYNALANGGKHLTLLALWNGVKGDGPGGTEEMVRQARERGAKTVIIDTKALFGLG